MDPFDLLTQYLVHRDALSPPLEDEARPVAAPARTAGSPEPLGAGRAHQDQSPLPAGRGHEVTR